MAKSEAQLFEAYPSENLIKNVENLILLSYKGALDPKAAMEYLSEVLKTKDLKELLPRRPDEITESAWYMIKNGTEVDGVQRCGLSDLVSRLQYRSVAENERWLNSKQEIVDRVALSLS